jgi:hypothetical protein
MKAKPTLVKILTCLLCLVIVGTALDSLPDPPAIRPPSIQKNAIFRHTQIPISAIANPASYRLSCRFQLHSDFTPATQAYESAAPPAEPFVLQAADASPPRRS